MLTRLLAIAVLVAPAAAFAPVRSGAWVSTRSHTSPVLRMSDNLVRYAATTHSFGSETSASVVVAAAACSVRFNSYAGLHYHTLALHYGGTLLPIPPLPPLLPLGEWISCGGH